MPWRQRATSFTKKFTATYLTLSDVGAEVTIEPHDGPYTEVTISGPPEQVHAITAEQVDRYPAQSRPDLLQITAAPNARTTQAQVVIKTAAMQETSLRGHMGKVTVGRISGKFFTFLASSDDIRLENAEFVGLVSKGPGDVFIEKMPQENLWISHEGHSNITVGEGNCEQLWMVAGELSRGKLQFAGTFTDTVMVKAEGASDILLKHSLVEPILWENLGSGSLTLERIG